jgi:ABC-type amino acid transport system permease subunit
MWTLLYLLIGVIVAVYASRPAWRRVSPGKQHTRLWQVCVVMVLAWPGVAILALCDTKLTVRQYVDQWVFEDSTQ